MNEDVDMAAFAKSLFKALQASAAASLSSRDATEQYCTFQRRLYSWLLPLFIPEDEPDPGVEPRKWIQWSLCERRGAHEQNLRSFRRRWATHHLIFNRTQAMAVLNLDSNKNLMDMRFAAELRFDIPVRAITHLSKAVLGFNAMGTPFKVEKTTHFPSLQSDNKNFQKIARVLEEVYEIMIQRKRDGLVLLPNSDHKAEAFGKMDILWKHVKQYANPVGKPRTLDISRIPEDMTDLLKYEKKPRKRKVVVEKKTSQQKQKVVEKANNKRPREASKTTPPPPLTVKTPKRKKTSGEREVLITIPEERDTSSARTVLVEFHPTTWYHSQCRTRMPTRSGFHPTTKYHNQCRALMPNRSGFHPTARDHNNHQAPIWN